MKKGYNGLSDDEDESDVSDSESLPKPQAKGKPNADVDSDAVDYSSDDDLRPESDFDEATEGDGDTMMTSDDLPPIRPFSSRDSARYKVRSSAKKARSLSARQLRRLEALTKAFLMKTMDNTHIRLVKNLVSSYDIFQAICKKYEGVSFHGDPYFIQHLLMEIKYAKGSDLTDFFLKLENAMKAASEATESVLTDAQKSLYLFNSISTTWKDDLCVWKGMQKYIPYEELKMSIEVKVREIQAQERYTLARGTPETAETKREYRRTGIHQTRGLWCSTHRQAECFALVRHFR